MRANQNKKDHKRQSNYAGPFGFCPPYQIRVIRVNPLLMRIRIDARCISPSAHAKLLLIHETKDSGPG